MADMMTFSDTVEEFMEQYKIVDTEGIYMSKGSELVPIFRMKQWFEQKPVLDEWCTDCKEYDSEKHCCPRFNKVIREALKDGQPEQKKGVWLVKNIPICIGSKVLVEVNICSNCGYVVEDNNVSNFCSVCGADMRGESE